ncbi:MAG: RNA polymerase sigma factor [Myxococcaceae bacterium]
MSIAPLPPAKLEPGISDEALIGRVLAGDVQVFELLMRRNNTRLYRAIRSLVRDESEVEELMQQTYVLAYSRLRQFAGGAQFSTWLLRIGVNEALQQLRRERRWPRAAPDVLEEEPAMHSTDATPELRLARAQLNHLLEQLVDGLPESHRSVFVLREIQQLSTAEVAEVLGLTPDNVKQRLSRAKGLLRAALEQHTGESVTELYPFEAPRCDRVVSGVLAQLTGGGGPPTGGDA